MSFYYPQCCVIARVQWENHGEEGNFVLQQAYTFSPLVRRAVVNINSYTEADTFEITLDYKAFPFDPRAIRSVDISIHMENTESLYNGGTPGLPGGTANVIEPTEDNVVFKGFADQERMVFDDSTRSITLRGRDYTSLFIDSKILKPDLINLALPLTTILQMIIASTPGAIGIPGQNDGIKLENRLPANKVIPIPASIVEELSSLGTKHNPKSGQSYWDVIQELVSKMALIAYVEIDKLVLSDPRTLYNPEKAVQFIYGKNLKNFEMQRNMGKQKGFNVIVRSIIGKKVETVRIPRDAKNLPIAGKDVEVQKFAAGGSPLAIAAAQANTNPAKLQEKPEPAPFISFVLNNVKSRSALIDYGEKVFEEISRQQLEGRLTTRDMLAPTDRQIFNQWGSGKFDVLKIRNGTPIGVFIDHPDINAIQAEKTTAGRIKYLISRGYEIPIANALATSISKFKTPFYTRSVTFTIDHQSGFMCDIDFVNFIETNTNELAGVIG